MRRPQKKVSRTDSPPSLSIRRTGVAHRGKNESGFGSWWLNARSLLVHSRRTMVAEPQSLVSTLDPHLRGGHVRGFATTATGRRRDLRGQGQRHPSARDRGEQLAGVRDRSEY